MSEQIKPVDDALSDALDELVQDMTHVQAWVRLHYGQPGEELMASKLRPIMSAACGAPTKEAVSAALVRLLGGVGRPEAFATATDAVMAQLRPDHQGATAAAA